MDKTMEHVKCDLCGAGDYAVLFSRKDFGNPHDHTEFNIVKCQYCGLMYTNPRPTEKEIGAYYLNEYYWYRKPKKRNKFQRLFRLLRKRIRHYLMVEFYGYPDDSKQKPGNRSTQFFKKCLLYIEYVRLILSGKETSIIPFHGSGKILDVGCGSGQRLASLREDGWDTYGVELSPLAAKYAKEYFGLNIITGNLYQANFNDKLFDVIIFNHSFEHMHSPTKILKKANQILKHKGLIKINVPNAGSIEVKLFKKWWFAWEVPRHLYHFNKQSVKEILKNTGFKVTKISYDLGTNGVLDSINCYLKYKYNMQLKQRKLLRMFLKPLVFICGHLGQSGAMTVHAEKQADVK